MREVDAPSEVLRKVPLAVEPSFPDALLGAIGELGPALFVPAVTEELEIVAGYSDAAACLFVTAAVHP